MRVNNCSVPDCSRKTTNYNKLCETHRKRKARTGAVGTGYVKPVPPPGLSHFEVIRFNGWKVTANDCWEYLGPRFAKGYGQVKAAGTKPKLAHRISYEFYKGVIPDGLLVRHNCDNPPCINPSHLLTGTSQDNVNDAIERGRRPQRKR